MEGRRGVDARASAQWFITGVDGENVIVEKVESFAPESDGCSCPWRKSKTRENKDTIRQNEPLAVQRRT